MLCGFFLVLAVRFVINETTIPDRVLSPFLVDDTSADADAIVVLGAGVVGECSPNLNGVRRVLLAARLFRHGRAPLMVITGGPAEVPCPVALAMAQLARDVGVPESAIRIERGSRTTWENGRLTAPILRAESARRLLVVTDRLHMPRAAGVFVRLGFDVEIAAVPIYEGHSNNVSMLTAAAREMTALAYYRMRDWVAPLKSRDSSKRAQHGTRAVGTTGSTMQADISNAAGPVVILGASYAGSWGLDTIAGHRVVNAGVPGQQSFEMLERFDRDVLPARPRAVILWGFINDVFRADDIDRSLARVRNSYTQMIARARGHGIEPILATEVTIRPPDTWIESIMSWVGALMGKESYQARINRHVMSTNSWLVDLAARERMLVLDLHGALAEEGGQRRREFIEDDGSHITPDGYAALTQYATPILNQHLSARPGQP